MWVFILVKLQAEDLWLYQKQALQWVYLWKIFRISWKYIKNTLGRLLCWLTFYLVIRKSRQVLPEASTYLWQSGWRITTFYHIVCIFAIPEKWDPGTGTSTAGILGPRIQDPIMSRCDPGPGPSKMRHRTWDPKIFKRHPGLGTSKMKFHILYLILHL